jgi:hypothetical protein
VQRASNNTGQKRLFPGPFSAFQVSSQFVICGTTACAARCFSAGDIVAGLKDSKDRHFHSFPLLLARVGKRLKDFDLSRNHSVNLLLAKNTMKESTKKKSQLSGLNRSSEKSSAKKSFAAPPT